MEMNNDHQGDRSTLSLLAFTFRRDDSPLGIVFADANVCWDDDSNASVAGDADSRTAAVVVQTVTEGSEAHELGVRPGMLLYGVGDHLVAGSTVEDETARDGGLGGPAATVTGFDAALLLIRKFGRPITLRFIVTES